jgi:hypothetical protein
MKRLKNNLDYKKFVQVNRSLKHYRYIFTDLRSRLNVGIFFDTMMLRQNDFHAVPNREIIGV